MTTTTTDEEAPDIGWAILELMGRRRLGGYVTETTLAGGSFLRIDVPGPDSEPIATQFYAPNAVYCITPTDEATARLVAAHNRPTPVQRWELSRPAAVDDGDTVDDFGEDDDHLEDYE